MHILFGYISFNLTSLFCARDSYYLQKMSAEMEVVSESLQDGVSVDMVNGIDDESIDGLRELSKDLSSRPIRKAKRQLGRLSPGKEVGPEGAAALIKKALPLAKNSRKSRDGRGRGLPKKGLSSRAFYICFGFSRST